MHLIGSCRITTHRGCKKTQFSFIITTRMALASKERLLDEFEVDPDVDLSSKQTKQSSTVFRTCYGVFTVVAVSIAILFTLIVVADLLDFARHRRDHGSGKHEYGYFVNFRYYILGSREDSVDAQSSPFSPPPYQDKAKTARYIVHYTDWATVSTLSKRLNGVPFGTSESFCDGPGNGSTGIPYFYMTPDNPSASDVLANPSASITVSEAQTGYCAKKNWDPEDPQCGRVCLSGKMLVLQKGSTEEQFAKNSLFARHPQMKDWPASHNWLVLKLNITNVWMLDYYGPSSEVPVNEYFDAKP